MERHTIGRIEKTAVVAREMKTYGIDVLEVSECRWTGLDRMRKQTDEPLLYSGRENDAHPSGVAMVSRKKATRCLISWSPVNDLTLGPPLSECKPR